MTEQTPNTGLFKKMGAAVFALILTGSVASVPVIKTLEGRSHTVYYDIAKIATYCDGETLNPDLKKTYTDAECDAKTMARAKEFAINAAANLEYQVSPKTFESIIIFSYNNGKEAFNNSSVRREINSGNVAAGCDAMMLYVCYTVKAGQGDRKPVKYKPIGSDQVQEFNCVRKDTGYNKKFSKGLANRRSNERKMCLAGANENAHP